MEFTRSMRGISHSIVRVNNIELPMDLIFDILSRLPIKPLLRFKSTCKTWYSLIQNRDFTEMHCTRSKLKNRNNTILTTSLLITAFDCENGIYNIWLQSIEKTPHLIYSIESNIPPRILGICDGMFCATFGDSETIICNPTTRGPVRRIPRFSLLETAEPDNVFFGFGSLQTQDSYDYKLFRIIYSSTSWNFCGEVYSMSNDIWRKIEVKRGENIDARLDLCSSVFFNSPPVTINEVFYRRAYISDVPCVMSFEMNGYVLDMIACPGELIRDFGFLWQLVDLKGELALGTCGHRDKWFKLWVMNEIDRSWTVKFKTGSFSFFGRSLTMLGYGINDNLVMQLDASDSEVKLFTYVSGSRKITRLPFMGLKKHHDFYLYTESLISV